MVLKQFLVALLQLFHFTFEFEVAGTGTDGATTLLDRIRVSEYLVIDDQHSTPFLSTATAVSTYTQTFVAAGSSGYQIIYDPKDDSGVVAFSQSCAFQGGSGQCVEKDWVVGQSSTQTTTFTGPAVPYWTVTRFVAATGTPTETRSQSSQTQTSTISNQNNRNSGTTQGVPIRLLTSFMIFIYLLMI
ncbi:hypothetical protein L218DRAFT_275036 [Marasmius fiardii PR-910]|nr:hypothetical protein L218DRAFT_275036 [Marasmius fiardii PR-910]